MSSSEGDDPGATSSYGQPDTRRRILDAARVRIASDGAGLRLADVATDAGVSRQAVYLHFGDREGLLVALVRHMDEDVALGPAIAEVAEAPTGGELVRRMMQVHGWFNPHVDAVALVLESAQYHDTALGAAWRDRMAFRRQVHRGFAASLATNGQLADDWSVDDVADLLHALTLPGPWRELTREMGWTEQRYVDLLSRLLTSGLVARDTDNS